MKKNIFGAILMSMVAISTNAQWNTDTLMRNAVATNPIFLEVDGHFLDDRNGGVYVIWQSYSGGPSIYAGQRFDSAGNQLWTAGGKMIVPSDGVYYYPEQFLLHSDTAGEFIIWDNDVPSIRVQKFNSNGDTLFAPYKTIYQGIPGYNAEQLYVLPDDSGGAIILWNEAVSFDYTLKEQRIDKNGSNFWAIPAWLRNMNNGGDLYGVAPDGNNGAFYFYRPIQPLHSFYVRRVARNGLNVWGSEVQISTTELSSSEHVSKVAYDSLTNGCYTFYYTTAGKGLIQYIDTAGTLRWSNGGIVAHGPFSVPGYSIHGQIITDGSGGIYFGYAYMNSPDTAHMRYVLKHFDSTGASTWNSIDTTVMTLSKNALYSVNDPEFKLTRDNSGGIIITWDEFRNNRLCIYSQRYNANGNKLWQLSGFPVITATNSLDFNGCSAGCDWLEHSTIKLGAASAVVAWTDNRNNVADRDLYVAKIDGNIPTGINESSKRNQVYMYPNPASDALIIDNLMEDGEILISNTIGEKVYESRIINPQVEINVHNFPSGIYFVKISDGKNIVVQKFVKM